MFEAIKLKINQILLKLYSQVVEIHQLTFASHGFVFRGNDIIILVKQFSEMSKSIEQLSITDSYAHIFSLAKEHFQCSTGHVIFTLVRTPLQMTRTITQVKFTLYDDKIKTHSTSYFKAFLLYI